MASTLYPMWPPGVVETVCKVCIRFRESSPWSLRHLPEPASTHAAGCRRLDNHRSRRTRPLRAAFIHSSEAGQGCRQVLRPRTGWIGEIGGHCRWGLSTARPTQDLSTFLKCAAACPLGYRDGQVHHLLCLGERRSTTRTAYMAIWIRPHEPQH